MSKLTNKVAIITGAARGIGKAIALGLAQEGAAVVISDIMSELAEQTAREITESGGKAIAISANVTHAAEAEELVKAANEKLGAVDILVNNAGITRDNLIIRMSEAEWQAVIDVNLKGCFNCLKAAAKVMMKQRSGRIINISSIVGLIGNAGQANYAASKAGMIGITKSAAKELASRGITVNAIAPGFIETEMTANLGDEVKAAFLKNIPLKRPGTPKDIADAVVFLASPEASYITGQVLTVDGGMVM
ncbi:3-oxoacyl-[acyl-carrier-protein] reductase [candidate division KSB1 bacterium]|nr:3-oxoacyl-[acyl-carrier-protein] reductase [candidate division KSB1 bacterium]